MATMTDICTVGIWIGSDLYYSGDDIITSGYNTKTSIELYSISITDGINTSGLGIGDIYNPTCNISCPKTNIFSAGVSFRVTFYSYTGEDTRAEYNHKFIIKENPTINDNEDMSITAEDFLIDSSNQKEISLGFGNDVSQPNKTKFTIDEIIEYIRSTYNIVINLSHDDYEDIDDITANTFIYSPVSQRYNAEVTQEQCISTQHSEKLSLQYAEGAITQHYEKVSLTELVRGIAVLCGGNVCVSSGNGFIIKPVRTNNLDAFEMFGEDEYFEGFTSSVAPCVMNGMKLNLNEFTCYPRVRVFGNADIHGAGFGCTRLHDVYGNAVYDGSNYKYESEQIETYTGKNCYNTTIDMPWLSASLVLNAIELVDDYSHDWIMFDFHNMIRIIGGINSDYFYTLSFLNRCVEFHESTLMYKWRNVFKNTNAYKWACSKYPYRDYSYYGGNYQFVGFNEVLKPGNYVKLEYDGAVKQILVGEVTYTWDGSMSISVTSPTVNADGISTNDSSSSSLSTAQLSIITNTSIDGANIITGSLPGTSIKDGSLIGAKLSDATITGSLIAESTITGSLIQESTLTNSLFQDGTIENSKIKDGTIEGSKIKESTITNSLIVDSTLTGAKIKDATIGYEKVDTSFITDLTADNVFVTNLIANEAFIDDLTADNAFISSLTSSQAFITDLDAKYMNTRFSNMDTADIDKANIGVLFNEVGLITSATITEGHITGYLDAVEVNANKITAGTLTTDRLVIRGTNKSIVYEINNITGAIQAQNVNTINGETLTKRTINADKLIANTITANEIHSSAITTEKLDANAVTADKIAANAITANKIDAGAITAVKIASNAITTDKLAANAVTATKIDVNDLFAQTITATGSITGATFYGANFIGSKAVTIRATYGSTTETIEIDTNGISSTGQVLNFSSSMGMFFYTGSADIEFFDKIKLDDDLHFNSNTNLGLKYGSKTVGSSSRTGMIVGDITTNGNSSYTIIGNDCIASKWIELGTSGDIASGNKKAVTGDTVYSALKTLTYAGMVAGNTILSLPSSWRMLHCIIIYKGLPSDSSFGVDTLDIWYTDVDASNYNCFVRGSADNAWYEIKCTQGRIYLANAIRDNVSVLSASKLSVYYY